MLAVARVVPLPVPRYDALLIGCVPLTLGLWAARVETGREVLVIGAFLWLAENAATFLHAWRYPNQGDIWRVVHVSKFGSRALLVSVSFVLVASLKRLDHRRRGEVGSDFDPPLPLAPRPAVGEGVPAAAPSPDTRPPRPESFGKVTVRGGV